MHFTTSAVRTVLTASRRYALMAGVCAATMGLVACGSDSSKDTKSTGSTTGSTTGTTTGTTTAGTTTSGTGSTTGTATQDCTPSGNASFVDQSPGVVYTPAGGGATVAMPYTLFIYNPNATDPNKKYAVSTFDYDYCAFSFDHGYSTWPIDGFHAASFYLLSANDVGSSFAGGTYNVTAGSAESIYLTPPANSFASGLTITSAGGGGGSCTGQTYPIISSGDVQVTGQTLGNTNAVTGVTGTFNITFNDGSTLSGPFSSGTCSNSQQATPPTPDTCACSLTH